MPQRKHRTDLYARLECVALRELRLVVYRSKEEAHRTPENYIAAFHLDKEQMLELLVIEDVVPVRVSE